MNTNIYHITYAPNDKSLYLHFWGCNMDCRACICKKEIYDCHLEETKDAIFQEKGGAPKLPHRFLSIDEVLEILEKLNFSKVIFMGAEPTIDAGLPELAETLHKKFKTFNILLTNGLKLIPMDHIDEVAFSIKAYRDELHRDYTGKSNKEVLGNFIKLYLSRKKLRAESIFIPEYIDFSEIERIARFIASVDKSIPYRIDAYIPVGDNPWRRPAFWETEEAVKIARRHLLNVSCLRGDEKVKYKVIRVF